MGGSGGTIPGDLGLCCHTVSLMSWLEGRSHVWPTLLRALGQVGRGPVPAVASPSHLEMPPAARTPPLFLCQSFPFPLPVCWWHSRCHPISVMGRSTSHIIPVTLRVRAGERWEWGSGPGRAPSQGVTYQGWPGGV